MKQRLLWKLLLNIIPVIGVTILVVWLAIDNLAATYFMRLMENYDIEPLESHTITVIQSASSTNWYSEVCS